MAQSLQVMENSTSVPENSSNNPPPPSGSKGPFDHPVYKKLAVLNGEINKMTKQQMVEKLAQLKLDTRGLKDVLKKRLKNYYKRRNLINARVTHSSSASCRYKYLLVIDFEATCEKDVANYPHEIIEFPVILVDTAAGTTIDQFHSYVRPTVNPRLTSFCTELTGITQEQIDKAPTFTEVLEIFDKWMESHQLGTLNKFAVVTDGPWDMSRFMHLQCLTSEIAFPKWAKKWINIRKAFCNKYRTKQASVLTMLECFGLAFEGRQHSGIDDARNISKIVIQMLNDGCTLNVNEKIGEDRIGDDGDRSRMAVVETVPRDKQSSSDDEDQTNMANNNSEDSESNTTTDDTASECTDDVTSQATLNEDSNRQCVDSDVDDCADLLRYVELQNS